MYGSHLSISGGWHKAALQAKALGFGTVQIFTQSPQSWGLTEIKPPADSSLRDKKLVTKNQQQWAAPPLKEEGIAAWCEACGKAAFEHTVSHDSYLINLASADDALWNKSVDAFTEELRRCEVLGIPLLVTHPGAHLGTGEEAGLRRVAQGLDEVHRRLPKAKAVTCLEITAGQGSSLGYKLEHLAEIMSLCDSPERLGVCLDTAHLLAAGYDFRGRKYAAFKRSLAATVGEAKVRVLHLNDSKKDLGTRVDRHEHIGRGFVGLEGFQPIVRDPAWKKIPKILETPKGKDEQGRDWDAINLEALLNLEK